MRTDVVVIGGGAVGAAVAYFLKFLDPSTQVSVVERDPTYSQASTPRGSGGVRRLFSLPENIELSKFSMTFFDHFAETMALDGVKADIGLKKHGYLFIVPPSAREVLKRNFDTQRRLGCNVLWLEPEGLKQMFPSMNVSDLGAAVYSPDDGWLVTRSVLMGFRNKATSMGVEFLADAGVGLVRKGKIVTTAKPKSSRFVASSIISRARIRWSHCPTSKIRSAWLSGRKGTGTLEGCLRLRSHVGITSTLMTPILSVSCGPGLRIGFHSLKRPYARERGLVFTTKTTLMAM